MFKNFITKLNINFYNLIIIWLLRLIIFKFFLFIFYNIIKIIFKIYFIKFFIIIFWNMFLKYFNYFLFIIRLFTRFKFIFIFLIIFLIYAFNPNFYNKWFKVNVNVKRIIKGITILDLKWQFWYDYVWWSFWHKYFWIIDLISEEIYFWEEIIEEYVAPKRIFFSKKTFRDLYWEFVLFFKYIRIKKLIKLCVFIYILYYIIYPWWPITFEVINTIIFLLKAFYKTWFLWKPPMKYIAVIVTIIELYRYVMYCIFLGFTRYRTFYNDFFIRFLRIETEKDVFKNNFWWDKLKDHFEKRDKRIEEIKEEIKKKTMKKTMKKTFTFEEQRKELIEYLENKLYNSPQDVTREEWLLIRDLILPIYEEKLKYHKNLISMASYKLRYEFYLKAIEKISFQLNENFICVKDGIWEKIKFWYKSFKMFLIKSYLILKYYLRILKYYLRVVLIYFKYYIEKSIILFFYIWKKYLHPLEIFFLLISRIILLIYYTIYYMINYIIPETYDKIYKKWYNLNLKYLDWICFNLLQSKYRTLYIFGRILIFVGKNFHLILEKSYIILLLLRNLIMLLYLTLKYSPILLKIFLIEIFNFMKNKVYPFILLKVYPFILLKLKNLINSFVFKLKKEIDNYPYYVNLLNRYWYISGLVFIIFPVFDYLFILSTVLDVFIYIFFKRDKSYMYGIYRYIILKIKFFFIDNFGEIIDEEEEKKLKPWLCRERKELTFWKFEFKMWRKTICWFLWSSVHALYCTLGIPYCIFYVIRFIIELW